MLPENNYSTADAIQKNVHNSKVNVNFVHFIQHKTYGGQITNMHLYEELAVTIVTSSQTTWLTIKVMLLKVSQCA